jgi:hypothetical protein
VARIAPSLQRATLGRVEELDVAVRFVRAASA